MIKVVEYGNGYAVLHTQGNWYSQRSNGAVEVFSTVAKAWRSMGVHTYPQGYAHNGCVYQTVNARSVKRAQVTQFYATPELAYQAFRAAK